MSRARVKRLEEKIMRPKGPLIESWLDIVRLATEDGEAGHAKGPMADLIAAVRDEEDKP